jgi:hypothetical protein
VGDTRFYTDYIAATRVLQVKSALQETEVSAEYKEWAEKQSYKAEAMRVKKLILDEDLWTDIELMVELFKPVVDLLRLVDSDPPTMGKVSHALGLTSECGILTLQMSSSLKSSVAFRSASFVHIQACPYSWLCSSLALHAFSTQPYMLQVYYYCSLMDARMANLTSPRFTASMKTEVRRLFSKRLDELSSPLHCAAYALDPEFQDHKFNPEVMRGLRQACLRVLRDADAAKAAMLGHAACVGKEGDFGDSMVIDLAKDMPSYQWWVMHGGEFPELQKVAVRVLAMVSSAGACERNWSAYDFVHPKKRHYLDRVRARDLVYVFTNVRLHKKSQKPEAFTDWNKGGEETQEEREVVHA